MRELERRVVARLFCGCFHKDTCLWSEYIRTRDRVRRYTRLNATRLDPCLCRGRQAAQHNLSEALAASGEDGLCGSLRANHATTSNSTVLSQ